jgi:hypothetical protein
LQRALASIRGKHALAARTQATPFRRADSPAVNASRRGSVLRAYSARLATVVEWRRSGSAPERPPMTLETARRAPSGKAVKVKARRAKHRVGMQRGRRG